MLCSRCGRAKANKTSGMCTEDEIAHASLVKRVNLGPALLDPDPSPDLPPRSIAAVEYQGSDDEQRPTEVGLQRPSLARRPPRGTA